MPVILAIETSHPRGSVAVVREGEVLFERSFTSQRSHNSKVFAPLAEALKVSGDALQTIVVGLGPGSYTGARIGIAAAQGIAVSRNVPVIGLPSVLAPEVENLPGEFIVCGDARRGLFFLVHIRDGTLSEEITLLEATELSKLHAAAAGIPWFTFDTEPPANLPGLILTASSAKRLALLADRLTSEQFQALADAPVLEPIYLRAPFITTPKQITPTAARDISRHPPAS